MNRFTEPVVYRHRPRGFGASAVGAHMEAGEEPAGRIMSEPSRLARWLAGDMRALAKLVDEAPAAALADDEVSSAREHLLESLEAAERAVRAVRAATDDAAELTGKEP